MPILIWLEINGIIANMNSHCTNIVQWLFRSGQPESGVTFGLMNPV